MTSVSGERRLVVTADDLGRDAAGTATICALWEEGLIDAATMIAVTEESPRAAARLRAAGLTPHLHLTLSSEPALPPWRPLAGGRSMRDARGALPGALRGDGHGPDPEEAIEEFEAQLAWMHAAGLTPRVVDFHTSELYVLHGGALLDLMLPWCARHGLGLRLPRRLEPFPGAAALPEALRAGHAAALRSADALGAPLPVFLLSHHGTARGADALRGELTGGLGRLPSGTSELVLHPSASGPGVPAVRPLEALVLRDPRWREALVTAGIRRVPHW